MDSCVLSLDVGVNHRRAEEARAATLRVTLKLQAEALGTAVCCLRWTCWQVHLCNLVMVDRHAFEEQLPEVGKATVDGEIKLGSGDDELLLGEIGGGTGEVDGGSGFDRLTIVNYDTNVLRSGTYNFSALTEPEIAGLFGDISVSGFEKLVLV